MILERSRIATFVGAFIAVALQLLIAPNIAISSALPNFVAAYVIVLSVTRPQPASTVLAFLLGLLYNLVAGGPVGGMALLLVLVAFLASRAFAALANDTLFMPIAILVVSSLVVELLYAALLMLLGLDVALLDALAQRVLPCALYDSVVGLVMYPLVLKFVAGATTPREPTSVR